jgi:hypothetical protein
MSALPQKRTYVAQKDMSATRFMVDQWTHQTCVNLQMRRIGWPADKAVISASGSAAIQCGAPCGGAVMKRKNKSIESLPQRLSNATLSDGTALDGRLLSGKSASVDLNQLDSKTNIAAVVGWQTQANVQDKRNRAAFDFLPKKEPREPKRAQAWKELHLKYPNHKIPKKKSAAEIRREVNTSLSRGPDRGSVSISTVQRVLGRKR